MCVKKDCTRKDTFDCFCCMWHDKKNKLDFYTNKKIIKNIWH